MITLSPQEIIALLLEVDNNDVPTDVLKTARHKLEAEYRRIAGQDPILEMFHMGEANGEEKRLTEYQTSLIDGYFALDPDARILGYYKGQPVVQAHTAPVQTRTAGRKALIVVSRDGSPKTLPLVWADNFIPAEGVTWAEAEVAIEDWLMHHQKKLASDA